MHRQRNTWFVFLFFWVSTVPNFVQAQQLDIPGVTDITSVTTVSSLNPAEFTRFLNKGCQDTTYFVRQFQNLSGIVNYRGDLKAYVIASNDPTAVYSPNVMVCSYWMGIVCNVPNVSNWLGKTVTFSGRYYQARGISARDAAEHVFYLHVTGIK